MTDGTIDWSKLRAVSDATGIQSNINSLKQISKRSDASKLYWEIESVIIQDNYLYEAALPTVNLLIESLSDCTNIALPHILELLVQIGSSQASPVEISNNNEIIGKQCVQAISKGYEKYKEIITRKSFKDIDLCIDLIGTCGLANTELYVSAKEELSKMSLDNKYIAWRDLISNTISLLEEESENINAS